LTAVINAIKNATTLSKSSQNKKEAVNPGGEFLPINPAKKIHYKIS
jgi:hypothetical protein